MLSISLSIHSQVDRTNFRVGLNAGTVTGDFSDFYSFTLGVDVLHVWGLSRELDLGLATGFTNAFGEEETFTEGDITVETEFDNAQFIPVAAAVRVYPTYGFKFGGDVGYAIGVNEGNEGGFYYRPIIGVDVNGSTELNVSYTAVQDDETFSSILLGVLFLF